MALKDITISVSNITVTGCVITIDANSTPTAGSTYAAFYSTASYEDVDRSHYMYYGGSSTVGGTTIDVGGLIPDTPYYLRVFEITAGDFPSPGIGYDYTEESTFTTEVTAAGPRIYDHFCSESPTNEDLRGGPVTVTSTSIRIGAAHVESGDGETITLIEFAWHIDGSSISHYQSLTDIQNYYDFAAGSLPIGAMISYNIKITNGSSQVAIVEGYT